MSSTDENKWRATLVAAQTLQSAIIGDLEAVSDVLESSEDTFGAGFVSRVMLSWVDILLAGLRDLGVDWPGTDTLLTWSCTECQTDMTADEVPAGARWAGWLIGARARNDRDQFLALINGIESDEQYTHYVHSVLAVCAGTLHSAACGCGKRRDEDSDES